jgi:hypothetical protein
MRAPAIGPLISKTLNGQISDVLDPEDRPCDACGYGRSLRFILSEHDEMTMPRAIEVRDAQGRWSVCMLLNGKIVRPQAPEQD